MSYYIREEATQLITKAWKEVETHEHYRFGQALWNLMECSTCAHHTGTETDFFYESDAGIVHAMFYKTFVIGGAK